MKNINIQDILFIDIETAPQVKSFSDLPEKMQQLWVKKAETFHQKETDTPENLYFKRAGIYAEFGKIICISVGVVNEKEGKLFFRVKSLAGKDERKILQHFKIILNKFYKNQVSSQKNLCAHNGKEFDFPYIIRRMLVNGLALPPMLQMFGKKPWEVPFLDTMEFWKFGDFKSYTSLDLLSTILEIPSPKEDIDGSMIGDIYWGEKDIARIASYCERDTLTVAQLFLKFLGKELILPENVEHIP